MASNGIKGATCLITGATGFIGSYLCRELVESGARVRIMRHNTATTCLSNLDEVKCNLEDGPLPQEALQDVDIVFHLAAHTHALSNSLSEDKAYYKLNVGGTKNLLEVASRAKVKKFIFFSSVKAIGEENNQRLNDYAVPKPTTFYGKSKFQAEQLVLSKKIY